MMYHAREIFSERGYNEETATSASGPVPQMPWSMAVELWHRIKSDLLASGVPPNRILPGGIYQILLFWKHYKKSFWDVGHSLPLPFWEYDSGVDGTDLETTRWSQSIPVMNRAGNEDEVTEAHGNSSIQGNAYCWPSDTERYIALASSIMDPWEASSKVRTFQNTFVVPTGLTGPSQVAQHRASTFQILTSIMKRLHRDLFDEVSSHESNETFWENLFIGPFDGSWHIPDHQRLRHRFGWVFDYIRDGWSIEARVAKDILREALAPNVLSCPFGI